MVGRYRRRRCVASSWSGSLLLGPRQRAGAARVRRTVTAPRRGRRGGPDQGRAPLTEQAELLLRGAVGEAEQHEVRPASASGTGSFQAGTTKLSRSASAKSRPSMRARPRPSTTTYTVPSVARAAAVLRSPRGSKRTSVAMVGITERHRPGSRIPAHGRDAGLARSAGRRWHLPEREKGAAGASWHRGPQAAPWRYRCWRGGRRPGRGGAIHPLHPPGAHRPRFCARPPPPGEPPAGDAGGRGKRKGEARRRPARGRRNRQPPLSPS